MPKPHAFLLALVATFLVTFSTDASTKEEKNDVSSQSLATSTNEATVPEFIATKDWQELLPGQGVPPGLHVRLNLETGKHEAKLADLNEDLGDESMRSVIVDAHAKKTGVTVSTDISGDIVAEEELEDTLSVLNDEDLIDHIASESAIEGNATGEPNWNHEKMYDVLQALPEPPTVKGMDIHEAREKLSPAEFRKQIIALWKKRQAELKEAFESLQDDAKYMSEILEQLGTAERNGDVEGQVSALKVLEWEVQDLDKTHVFNFIGGFSIIAEYLNSTNLPVRSYAAWVVGSAAKNYEDGQEWAIDAGVVPKLFDSLTLKVSNVEESADEILEVKSKAIYALSSIVRSNARGQRLFLIHNGPELLARVLTDEYSVKLHLKAPELAYREVIQLVDCMRLQLPACQNVHRASGVKSVVEKLAYNYVEDPTLDDEEKQELMLFFEDFLRQV
ncbi:hypothetical protein PsorP6_017369 [Peronosclerospora sorghi]|uniref:Uncharacterized protein n=1 Tax=Peronosclerospora sorghi TaxID=230839 RepID=A0ACC0WMY0_9STRA|nr:hypothetical protein PsorP6_017369 [Peronosclerospora sorghi]